MKREIILIELLIILLIGFSGCLSSTKMVDENATLSTTMVEHIPTEIWTLSPTKNSLSATIPESTATKTPELLTARIPTSTLETNLNSQTTPIPTLEMEESQSVFRQWLDGSSDCRLPCWAGVVPGETTWETAKYLVSYALNVEYIDQDFSCYDNICSGFGWNLPYLTYSSPVFGSILEVNNEVVTNISVVIRTPEFQIPIDRLIIQYGLPERVLIFAGYSSLDNYVSNKIILIFPNAQFIIRYDRSGWLSGGNIWSCGPFEETDLRISSNIESNWDLNQILVELNGEREFYLRYSELEEVTEFSIESFAELFINDPDACFEIEKNY